MGLANRSLDFNNHMKIKIQVTGDCWCYGGQSPPRSLYHTPTTLGPSTECRMWHLTKDH